MNAWKVVVAAASTGAPASELVKNESSEYGRNGWLDVETGGVEGVPGVLGPGPPGGGLDDRVLVAVAVTLLSA